MPELPENIVFPIPKTQQETDLYNTLNGYFLKVSEGLSELTSDILSLGGGTPSAEGDVLYGTAGSVWAATPTDDTTIVVDGTSLRVKDGGITTAKLASPTGSDTNIVTGTAGAAGKLAVWNGDGDLVEGAAYISPIWGKTGTSITPIAGGDALDATIIGSTTPAAGTFTGLTISKSGQARLRLIDTSDTNNYFDIYTEDATNSGVISSVYSTLRNTLFKTHGNVIFENNSGTERGRITSTGYQGVIGATTPAAITGTTITANTAFAGALNGTVGATTPAAATFTLLTSTGGVVFPTSDPAVAGVWWDNAGTLTKSSG